MTYSNIMDNATYPGVMSCFVSDSRIERLAPDFLATLAALARLSGHFTISNAASNTHNWFPSVCFCHEKDPLALLQIKLAQIY